MADAIKNVKDAKNLATFIREEDLDDLEELSKQITDLADKATQDGRIYLLQQYIRLSAVIRPEIKRVKDRFDRESIASLRKEEKRLKAARKAEMDGLSNDEEEE
jgi:hypothetical protein